MGYYRYYMYMYMYVVSLFDFIRHGAQVPQPILQVMGMDKINIETISADTLKTDATLRRIAEQPNQPCRAG